jgi:hypothetical protein
MDRRERFRQTKGGFIPLADGRVRKDIPLDNYLYYRRLFEEVTQRGASRGIR